VTRRHGHIYALVCSRRLVQ